MMNGGQKMLLNAVCPDYRYQASPTEEYQWQQKLIAYEVKKLDVAISNTNLKMAIETLAYHSYPNLKEVLLQKLTSADPNRQIVIATALWTLYRFQKSFPFIRGIFLQNIPLYSDAVFQALNSFYDNESARKFVIDCLEGADSELLKKALETLSLWAHSELEVLRDSNIVRELKKGEYGSPEFNSAVEKVKTILSGDIN